MVNKAQELNISDFREEGGVEEDVLSLSQQKLSPRMAQTIPYDSPALPRDILQYLPPNGNPFSLFGDPYAQLRYISVDYNVIRTCQYWLRNKEEDNNFTKNEVALLTFLVKHRVATRAQIKCAVFNNQANDTKVKEFIKKMTSRGVLVAFKWVTPCKTERKTPRLYGLSSVAIKAARELFNRVYVPRNFQFAPVDYVPGNAPSMNEYFSTVIANEFYCKLHEIDRVIDWTPNELYSLPNGYEFRPNYSIKTIKDAQDFKYLWLEVIRPIKNWYTNCIQRFQQIQNAYTTLTKEIRPEVVVLLVDDVSRIPDVAKLALLFMPDVPVRYTTDERLIQRNDYDIFYSYAEGSGLTLTRIRHLTPSWTGMTASQYHASFYNESFTEDDDDDDY